MALTRFGVGLAIIAVTAVLGTGSAQAQPSAPEVSAVAPAVRPAIAKATSFAGYVGNEWVSDSDTVTTTFTVPRLRCTRTNRVIRVAAGIESGLNGDDNAWPFIDMACYRGKARYGPGFDFDNKATTSSRKVGAGNRLTLKTTETVSGFTVISITNASRHYHISQRKADLGEDTFPLIVELLQKFKGQRGAAEVPVFKTVVFSRTVLDGLKLGSYPVAAIDMASSKGVVKIATGAVSSQGEGFTSTFRHT